MRTMPRISKDDYHFQDTFPNGKKLAEMVLTRFNMKKL